MEIRLATLTDKEEIMALYRSHFGEEGVTWGDGYPNEEILVHEDILPGNLFCAVENGEIVAVTSLEDDAAINELHLWDRSLEPVLHIARVGVKHGWEGRGLARMLILHAMEEMRVRGMRGVRCLVGYHNHRAQAAYAPLGFHRAGEAYAFETHWLCYEKAL